MDAPSEAIFISYRHGDTAYVAGRLKDRIADRFGDESVFMDVVALVPGFDFVKAINKALRRCRVLLVVIDKRWVSAVNDEGVRRLDDPEDMVVLEVGVALRRKIHVIPILVDGASMPEENELRAPLAGLARRQGFTLDHKSFETKVGELLDVILQELPEPAPEPIVVAAPLRRRREPAQERPPIALPWRNDDTWFAKAECRVPGRQLGSGTIRLGENSVEWYPVSTPDAVLVAPGHAGGIHIDYNLISEIKSGQELVVRARVSAERGALVKTTVFRFRDTQLFARYKSELVARVKFVKKQSALRTRSPALGYRTMTRR